MTAAIERRLRYELGMRADEIELVLARYQYRAPPFRGIVEHEFCPVFIALAAGEPQPNPAEVEDFAWVRWSDFVRDARTDSDNAYSWWCKEQLAELVPVGQQERAAAFATAPAWLRWPRPTV